MIKSPLRYPGGKSSSVKVISKLIPYFSEFREPFVGGGSVFIYLKQCYPEKKYWVNDLYENLYHFWNELKIQPDGLIHQIRVWKNGFDNGKELHRFLLDNIDDFNSLEKAAAFFVFNRITFSGTTESGGFSNAAFKKRFTESSIERVKLLSTILNDVRITNYDYQKVIDVINFIHDAGADGKINFWKPNIRSVAKLYEKFPAINIKMESERARSPAFQNGYAIARNTRYDPVESTLGNNKKEYKNE